MQYLNIRIKKIFPIQCTFSCRKKTCFESLFSFFNYIFWLRLQSSFASYREGQEELLLFYINVGNLDLYTRKYCTCNIIIGTWLLQYLQVVSRYLQVFSTWSGKSFLSIFSLQSARGHGSSSNWQSVLKCIWKIKKKSIQLSFVHVFHPLKTSNIK